MEQQVVFRDYQEAQTADFNNIEAYAQQSFDDLVNAAVTASLRYFGFDTVISNTAEVTVAPGLFFGANANGEVGAVYALPTQSIISLTQYLAVSTQFYLALVVSGSLDLINVQTRDFLTNTTTLQTEPQAVAMTQSRDAVLSIIAGAEGPNPQVPAIGTAQVLIASILMDTTGVVSVTMNPDAMVTSTEDLNARLQVVEEWDAQTGPRIANLAADLAALANEIANMTVSGALLVEMMQDIADLKAKVGLPDNYSQYGAAYFLSTADGGYDFNNTQSLGWNALIDYGIRFPAENADEFALALFNPLDPNASYNSGSGLLLPAFTSVLALQTGNYVSEVPIGQYGYQTFTYQELDIPYMRLQAGSSYSLCQNGASAINNTAAPNPVSYLPNYEQYEISDVTAQQISAANHGGTATWVEQVQNYWLETWTEPYWVLDAVEQTINGALIAQSFLVSSDCWITQIGIFLAAIASATDVNIQLCECTNGAPDLTQVLATGTLAGANLVTGINLLTINPTFVPSGTRCAVVITSEANHQLGLAAAGSYLDGSFFYSLDGAYFLGDFQYEMVLQIYTAQFETNQVAIQLASWNLEGGIRNVDLTVRAQIPSSCELYYQLMPEGTGTWIPITADAPLAPFADAPVLCQVEAVFVGAPNIMPGLVLPDSICNIWAPGPAFTFVSDAETLASPSSNISVKLDLQYFNPTAHTVGIDIYGAVPATGAAIFTANPANGTTITLGGTVVTFTTGTPSGNQVAIGPSLQTTLSNLATFCNESSDANISKCSYGSDATHLYIVYKTADAGNSFTVGTTVSGVTLPTGGTLSGASSFAQIAPSAMTTTLTDATDGSYAVQATFAGMPAISQFSIVVNGTTNSISDVFIVSDMVWWAL